MKIEERIKEVTAVCVLNLVSMADMLREVGFEEDAKQVSEAAMDVCGYGRFAFYSLKEKEAPETEN